MSSPQLLLDTVDGQTRKQMEAALLRRGASPDVARHYVAVAFGDLLTDTPDPNDATEAQSIARQMRGES